MRRIRTRSDPAPPFEPQQRHHDAQAHRGQRNEPAYVGLVLQKLAEIRGWSSEEADRRTTDAFFALFDRIPWPAE